MSKEELDRIAALCDIALQDALTEIEPDVSVYDGAKFAKALAGNGYKVVPVEDN